MILYNVTVNVEEDIHEEWLQWMQEVHIPDVMATGLFAENRIFKILSKYPEETGVTYSIQYLAQTLDDYDTYQREHAPRLQQEHTSRYEGKFVAFRTILEQV